MSQKIRKRFTPNIATEEQINEVATVSDFDSLISAEAILPSKGSIIKGIVIGVENDIVVIDVGLKSEGRIPMSEFKLEINSPDPQVGDVVEIYVDKLEGINGKTVLSRAKAIREKAWQEVSNSFAENKIVQGTIFERVRGGFAVDLCGVVAFLPGSQVDLRPVDANFIQELMSTPQKFRIIKMDHKLGNIVVSRRAVLEDERSEAKKALLGKIIEGETIMEGVVKNITEYGAFIDLGSVDALLHITDISWKRINYPLEVLSIGQKVKVKVIKFDKETLRLHVGMKQLTESPWKQIASELPIGKVLKGRISKVETFGAFVELKDDIEGLVHSTEISWSKNPPDPKKVLKVDQEIEYVVKEIDIDKHKISLSMKRCRTNPWQIFADNHSVGQVIKTKIRNIAENVGIFVALGDEIDGIIHLSDISWQTASNQELLKNYSKDQEIEAKILIIDVEKEQVRLGIKQLEQDPYEQLLSADKVDCIITKLNDDQVEVKTTDGLRGIIKRNELALDRAEQKISNFEIGQEIRAKALNYDKNSDIIFLSIRELERKEHDEIIKTYGSIDSSSNNVINVSKIVGKEDKE